MNFQDGTVVTVIKIISIVDSLYIVIRMWTEISLGAVWLAYPDYNIRIRPENEENQL